MKRCLATVVLLVVALTGMRLADADPTITRYPTIQTAQQRGCTDYYEQDVNPRVVVLQRGDTCDTKINGMFTFTTDIASGTTVTAAFMQGWNDFGQSTTMTVYGDLSGNGPLLARARTLARVNWNPGRLQNTALYSPNLASIINELDRQPGWDGTVTFLFVAGANSDHQGIDIRTLSPAPTLEVQVG